MLILDKTSYALLEYLIQLEQPKTITEISNHVNQSRRKIYYHLQKINQALPDDVDKIINYPRMGIILNSIQKHACTMLLNKLDKTHYVMSIDERKWLIILYICISPEYITINKLMKLVDVSRNTILNDLNNIRSQMELDQFHIQLRVTKADGYYLECHPLSKIQFIYKILQHIYNESSDIFITTIRDRLLSSTNFSNYYSKEKTDFLKQLLREMSHDLGKSLNQKDSEFMLQILPYLLMSYQNMIPSSYNLETIQKDFHLAQERIEYDVASKLVQKLEVEFDVTYDDMAKNIIAVLLLSFRKDIDIHNHSHDYDEMRKTLDLFLSLFEHEYRTTFTCRNTLLNQLLTHCKSLLYQKTYNIPSDAPFTNHIQHKFSHLFNITKRCVPILEKAWLIHMTNDDIAYIAVHLGGAIHNKYNNSIDDKKITLICDEGIGIRKFFLKQCQTYISKYYIDTVFTLEEFHSVKDILKSNMIISTSDAIETDLPLIIVHPILTNEDIISIISFIHTSTEKDLHAFSNKLENILKPHMHDEKERYTLRNQIEKVFLKELLHYLETKNF